MPSGSVTGLDPSPHRILIASENREAGGVGNAYFALGYGEDLSSLPDGGFDAVYYSAVFHWIEDKKAALREAYRVLKPGGTVGIYTGCRGDSSSTMGYLRQIASQRGHEWPDRREGRASMWLTKAKWKRCWRRLDSPTSSSSKGRRSNTSSRPRLFPLAEGELLRDAVERAPEHLRSEVRRRIAEALEQRRTPQGIEIRSSLLFATASRPRSCP